MQFLSENHLNGFQIFGRFFKTESKQNFGFLHIPSQKVHYACCISYTVSEAIRARCFVSLNVLLSHSQSTSLVRKCIMLVVFLILSLKQSMHDASCH